MPTTIVITGGTGFVGRHLVRELVASQGTARLIVWDTAPANIPGAETLVVDITQPQTYREALAHTQPDWLIHLAAVTAVGESFKDPVVTHRINVEASETLFRAVQEQSPATRILAVSSADIYGASPAVTTQPVAELPLSAATPVSPYGKSKLALEELIEANFNDRTIRVRPFPHIGPGQRQGFVVTDFASQIAAIESAAEGHSIATIKVGNLEAVRDFTDVRDVVRAYRLLLEQGKTGEVYHVASGVGRRIQTVLDQLLALSTKKITVQEDAARLRPVDIPRLVGDAGKLRAATGWQPEISFTQSLSDTLNYWRERIS